MGVGAALRLILALALATLAMSGGAAPPASPPTSLRCDTLTRLDLPQVTIDGARDQVGGDVIPAPGTMLKNLPSFCRVFATARPTADSDIRFEVWIPTGGQWNGKFLGVGNDAFLGAPNYALMADALRRGYATASTDTGHRGSELDFATGHPEKIVDWAYRSIHLVAQNAKLIVRAATGRLPARSYFNGCNTGGHQALMEAQRFPEDYDGIIAGAPAAARVHEIIGYLGVWKATHDAAGKSLLSHADLQRVTAAATKACDADDGLRDGVIGDPLRCRFDPSVLRCKGTDSAHCLSAAQVEAVRAVYRGVHNPRTGALLFAGWPVGSEGYGPSPRDGWNGLINIPGPRRGEFFNNFVFDNPDWDWRTFDMDRDAAYADTKMGFVSAVDPDLRAFRARGGKLLMYAGWVDPILPGHEVIDYYEQIEHTMGARATAEFLRFYMIPGYAHCSGGPGPTAFDMITPLDDWLQHARPPETLLATRPADKDGPGYSRPLCRFPKIARWSGRGDPADAAGFSCVLPLQQSKGTSHPLNKLFGSDRSG